MDETVTQRLALQCTMGFITDAAQTGRGRIACGSGRERSETRCGVQAVAHRPSAGGTWYRRIGVRGQSAVQIISGLGQIVHSLGLLYMANQPAQFIVP